MQVITDACVKIAVLEIFSEENTRESVVRNFKNISTVAVPCWYIKDAFAGFCLQIILKRGFWRHFRENWQTLLSRLADFGY